MIQERNVDNNKMNKLTSDECKLYTQLATANRFRAPTRWHAHHVHIYRSVLLTRSFILAVFDSYVCGVSFTLCWVVWTRLWGLVPIVFLCMWRVACADHAQCTNRKMPLYFVHLADMGSTMHSVCLFVANVQILQFFLFSFVLFQRSFVRKWRRRQSKSIN